MGALVSSSVLKALKLQSRSLGCKSKVHATLRRDFKLLFLSRVAPGSQLSFQPHLCVWATHRRLFLTCSGVCEPALAGLEWGAGAMVATPFACHSAMALYFRSGLGFLLKHSQLWNFSLASPKTVSLATAVLSPRLFSRFHTLASSPFAHQQAPFPGWGVQGCGRPVSGLSSHSREVPLLSQLISLLVSSERGFSGCRNLSFALASPLGYRSHPISSSLFSFFHPTQLHEVCLFF